MRDSIKRIRTLAGRNVKEILRDPLSLIFMMGLPLFMEILFFFIFHKLTAQFEIRYLAPGIAVFAQAFTTLFAGLLIALDRGTSFLTRLYVSKARSYEFIFGYTLSLLPVALVQSALFFLVGGLLDPSFWSVRFLWGILLCGVTSLLFIGLGILFGATCSEKSVGGVSSAVIAGQSILSGMWFPTEGLGDGFLTALRVLPFKNATMLIQNAVNGYGDFVADMLCPLLIVLAYTAAAFALAIVVFQNKMKRA